MQQTKSYWRWIAAAGVVSAFIGSACTVTTSTDDETAGAAGSGIAGSGTAGSGTAGTGTAGTNTAGSGTAGSETGGAGPVPFQCDPGEGGAQGEPNDCTPTVPGDKCQECIQASCCAQYEACYAVSPGNQCGWGGPAKIGDNDNHGGEALCMITCIQDGVQLSGTDPDSELVGTCGNECATTISNKATKECGSVIGTQTSYLTGCMLDNCSKVCYGPLDP